MVSTLRVAVVGSGPAGLYAVGQLLEATGLNVQIDLFERLPTPWGLVRYGVAPDHPQKKQVIERLFNRYFCHPAVRFFGNVEIGKQIDVSDLSAWYHAVIFATGADGEKRLNIPGETLSGCRSAGEFVAWYNGHPDFSQHSFNMTGRSAVIVGNGNVALDVARMLCAPVEELARTDIADHALTALQGSQIEEVIILGRRGLSDVAFSNPELEAIGRLPNVDIRLENPIPQDVAEPLATLDWVTRRKVSTLQQLARRPSRPGAKRIVFRFWSTVGEALGHDRLEQLTVLRSDTGNARLERIDAGLLLRAIGYAAHPISGLPLDHAMGVIPNEKGCVSDTQGNPIPGLYVTGWVKRGPKGIIGSNKRCATETVSSLLCDYAAERLQKDIPDETHLWALLAERLPEAVDRDCWQRIDRSELTAGRSSGRPRVKITDREQQLRIARMGMI